MRLRSRLVLLLLSLSLVASGALFAGDASAQTPSTVKLPGHVLGILSSASKAANHANAAAVQQPILVTIVLQRSDEAGFQAYLRDVNNSASANYQHFLDQAALAARFGPSQQAYDAVANFLTQSGLTVVINSANRLTITAQGTRSQIEQAFGTVLSDYSLQGQSFYANDSDPQVPAALAANIHAVLGLNNLGKPKPVADAAALTSAPTPPSPTPLVLPQAYDFGGVGGATGQGQKIGLVEYATYATSDVQTWASLAGVPAARVNQLARVDLGGGAHGIDSGTIEVMLDVETVMAMAPGANYTVYDAPNDGTTVSWPAMFNAMINDGDTIISNSWSLCDNAVTQADMTGVDTVLSAAAGSGIAVFSASGDYGNSCAANNGSGTTFYQGVGLFPAESAYDTVVGGTSLLLDGSGNYASESYWNTNAGQGLAGGYWTGALESKPAFQNGVVGGSQRQGPDVSADAGDGIYVVINGHYLPSNASPSRVDGTSEAAPEWAAGMALIYQQLGHRLGDLNGKLYALGGTNAFHSPASMGSDFQHVGLGSFDLGQLYSGLGGAPSCDNIGGAGQLSQPDPCVPLNSSSPTFSWQPGNATSFDLYFGTTGAGSSNLGTSGVLSASTAQYMAKNLPTNGKALYVRFWRLVASGGWLFTDYVYTACTGACTGAPPAAHFTGGILISGANAPSGAVVTAYAGSTLCGTATGAGLYNGTAYTVDINGALAPCNTPGTTLSFQVNGQAASPTGTVPSTAGATVQLNLTSTAPTNQCPPAIASPTPGSALAGGSATFQWTPCSSATGYWLYVGTGGVGSSNVFTNSAALPASTTQQVVQNLPTSGTIYVRLWYLQGSWQFVDDTYTGSSGGGGGTPQLIVNTPTGCGTTSPSGTSSVTAGSGVSISATPCDGSHSFSSWSITGASCTGGLNSSPCAFTMPNSSVTVTATFIVSGGGGCGASASTPAIVQPAPGSTLGSSATFCWTAGSSATGYWLYVGTYGAGSYNVFSSGNALPPSTTQTTVSSLPASGTIYVRLWYLVQGTWQFVDYTYTG